MRPVLVLHELGDERGGMPWREAFSAAGFPHVIAPDLPGHCGQAAPVGGNYTMTEAGFAVAGLLANGLQLEEHIVVGIGQSGWSAQILAMAGHIQGLVMVDGIGGPWIDARSRVLQRRTRSRAIVSDPEALGDFNGGGMDPRLRHVIASHGDRELAQRAAALTLVPTLVLESTSVADDELIAGFGAGCERQELKVTPQSVAEAVAVWVR